MMIIIVMSVLPNIMDLGKWDKFLLLHFIHFINDWRRKNNKKKMADDCFSITYLLYDLGFLITNNELSRMMISLLFFSLRHFPSSSFSSNRFGPL